MTKLFIILMVALVIRIIIYKVARQNKKEMESAEPVRTAVSLFRGDPFIMDAVPDVKIVRRIYYIGVIVGSFVVLFDYPYYFAAWAVAVLAGGFLLELLFRSKKFFVFDAYVGSLILVLALPVVWITGVVVVLVKGAEKIIYVFAANPERTIESITGPSNIGSIAAAVSALVLLGLVLYDIWHMFGVDRPFSLFRFSVRVGKKELVLAKQVGNKEVIHIDLSKPYEYAEAYVYVGILGPTYGRFVKKKVYVFLQDNVYLAFLFYPGLPKEKIDSTVPYFYHTDTYRKSEYGQVVHPFDRKNYTEFENVLERKVKNLGGKK